MYDIITSVNTYDHLKKPASFNRDILLKMHAFVEIATGFV